MRGRSPTGAWRRSDQIGLLFTAFADFAFATAFAAMSARFRLLQNGFVRSYALALLAGATVVVLALLAVNFG